MDEFNKVLPISKDLIDKLISGDILKKDYDSAISELQNRAHYVVAKIGQLTGR